MKRIINQAEMPVSPKPTDGRWSPKECYYSIGERVTIMYDWPGEVVAYERTQWGRVNYIVNLDEPIQGESEWNTLLEDIEGGPWHKSHPQHSHNIEFAGAVSRGGCAIDSCVVCAR